MFGDNKRLHTSYLSDGVLSSLSSSSRQAVKYQHHEPAKSTLHENRSTISGVNDSYTLTERKNGVNRMIDLVDPSSLNLPTNNDAKALTSDSSLMETRRRSHRPRGCRGGRKNRKNQQAKAQALIPKEILDDTSNNHSVSKHSQENVQMREKPVAGTSISCAGGLPFMSQSYGGTTAFSTQPLGCVLDRSKQSPSPPPAPPTEILPPVNAMHESKESFGYSFSTHMASAANPCTRKVLFYAQSHNMRAEPYKPTPCGPLTLNAAVAHNISAASKLPLRAPPGCNPASAMDDYQTYRIQKQHQMMSTGGSLFATSPRSFLLGRPSEVSNIAW